MLNLECVIQGQQFVQVRENVPEKNLKKEFKITLQKRLQCRKGRMANKIG